MPVDPKQSPWDELADGVFRRRYPSLDLNVGLVIGRDGALVVDTRASHRQGRELRDEIVALTAQPVRWVVNTHYHWDHVFGNAVFPEAELWGHVLCRRHLVDRGAEAKDGALAWVGEAGRADIDEVEIVPPTQLIETADVIDVGDRFVAMEWLGRGHTDSDLVISVSDADVLFAGDLLESGAPPYYGDGFPLAWPKTARMIQAAAVSVTVPGHGDVMTPSEVATQVEEISAVAAACSEALASGSFDPTHGPYPVATMEAAWVRAQLHAEEPP